MKSAVPVLMSLFIMGIVVFVAGCTESHLPSGVECTTSNDCATGGCSNELCGAKGIVEKIPSMCVFEPEYECLQLTTCSCINNTCKWEQNQEYHQCMLNISED